VLLRVEVSRDLDRLVGRARVQRAAVVGRDDGDGADPELAAGAEDAQRDLAAIRDEELAKRGARPGYFFLGNPRSGSQNPGGGGPGGGGTGFGFLGAAMAVSLTPG
jgi:hypothetical protein